MKGKDLNLQGGLWQTCRQLHLGKSLAVLYEPRLWAAFGILGHRCNSPLDSLLGPSHSLRSLFHFEWLQLETWIRLDQKNDWWNTSMRDVLRIGGLVQSYRKPVSGIYVFTVWILAGSLVRCRHHWLPTSGAFTVSWALQTPNTVTHADLRTQLIRLVDFMLGFQCMIGVC